MLVANFMRFRKKLLEKQTHIDNFWYIFLYSTKNLVNFQKKIEKNFENNFFNFFIFEKKVGKNSIEKIFTKKKLEKKKLHKKNFFERKYFIFEKNRLKFG